MPYELAHDTIARQVYEKASTEARTRRKVERYVREHHEAYQERGVQLTQDDLDYIGPYLSQINVTDDEQRFLSASRAALRRQERKRRIIIAAIIFILGLISVVALYQSRIAEQERKTAVLAQQDADSKADSLVQKEALLQASLREAQVARDTARSRQLAAELAQLLADKNAREAARQQSFAQASARKARSIALAAKGREIMVEDPTVALNLAMKARALEPTESAINLISDLMANPTFSFYGKDWAYGGPSSMENTLLLPQRGKVELRTASLIMTNQNGELLWELALPPAQIKPYACGQLLGQNRRIQKLPENQGLLVLTCANQLIHVNWKGEVVHELATFEEEVTAFVASEVGPGGYGIAVALAGGRIIELSAQGDQQWSTQLTEEEVQVVDMCFHPRYRQLYLITEDKLWVISLPGGRPVKSWSFPALSESFTYRSISFAGPHNYLLLGEVYSSYSDGGWSSRLMTEVLRVERDLSIEPQRLGDRIPGAHPQYYGHPHRAKHFVLQEEEALVIYEWRESLPERGSQGTSLLPFPNIIRRIDQQTQVNQFAVNPITESIVCFRGQGPVGANSFDWKTGIKEWVKTLWIPRNDYWAYDDLAVSCAETTLIQGEEDEEYWLLDSGEALLSREQDISWAAPVGWRIVDAVFNPKAGSITVACTPAQASLTAITRLQFHALKPDLTNATKLIEHTYSNSFGKISLVPDQREMYVRLDNRASYPVFKRIAWDGSSSDQLRWPGYRLRVTPKADMVLNSSPIDDALVLSTIGQKKLQKFVFPNIGDYDYYGFVGHVNTGNTPFLETVAGTYRTAKKSDCVVFQFLLADYFWENAGAYRLSSEELVEIAPDLF